MRIDNRVPRDRIARERRSSLCRINMEGFSEETPKDEKKTVFRERRQDVQKLCREKEPSLM